MKHFEGVFKDSLNPLDGLTVVEASTLFAGPLAGMYLGDYGAEVVKIEHPRDSGSGARSRARAKRS